MTVVLIKIFYLTTWCNHHFDTNSGFGLKHAVMNNKESRFVAAVLNWCVTSRCCRVLSATGSGEKSTTSSPAGVKNMKPGRSTYFLQTARETNTHIYNHCLFRSADVSNSFARKTIKITVILLNIALKQVYISILLAAVCFPVTWSTAASHHKYFKEDFVCFQSSYLVPKCDLSQIVRPRGSGFYLPQLHHHRSGEAWYSAAQQGETQPISYGWWSFFPGGGGKLNAKNMNAKFAL